MGDMGYYNLVTSYHADGGIDVILLGSQDETVGVQVKRSKNSIKVEQIRSLAGALVLEGLTRGLFVTTSRFQRGCKEATDLYSARGLPIELVDSEALFSALRISKREAFLSGEEIQDLVNRVPLILRGQSIGTCSAEKDIPLD